LTGYDIMDYQELSGGGPKRTASMVWWSEFLAANPEVPGSILGATRFSEQQCVWNGVHSALMRINEELLERKK
jgi:hypothetical protein